MEQIIIIRPAIVQGSFVADATSEANATTFTFADLVPARTTAELIVLALAYAGNNNRTISSVTLAGTSATVRHNILSGGGTRAAIADAEVPAGAAGDVVITLSGNLGITAVMLASIYRLGNAQYRAGDTDQSTETGAVTLSVLTGEYVIGVVDAFRNGAGAAAIGWTGVVEQNDVDVFESRLSSAAVSIATSQSLAITATSPGAEECALAVAAYEAV